MVSGANWRHDGGVVWYPRLVDGLDDLVDCRCVDQVLTTRRPRSRCQCSCDDNRLYCQANLVDRYRTGVEDGEGSLLDLC